MSKLLVFSLLMLAIFLAAPTIKDPPVIATFFANSTQQNFVASLNTFRAALPVDQKKNRVYNISLLRTNVTATGSSRYTQVQLINSKGHIIRLAIDVTNVYVLGFYTPQCNDSYFFNDTVAKDAKRFLFKDSKQNVLPFDGSYSKLKWNKADRSFLTLGLSALNKYVTTLHSYSCSKSSTIKEVAKAMVVVIQMISEAARFEMIEKSFPNNRKPTKTVLSLENKWSKLSKQVRAAERNKGTFQENIILDDINGHPTIIVSDINSPYVRDNIRLLLNR